MALDQKRLKVGLLINETGLPAWACQMIDIIAGSDYAEIVLVVRSDNSRDSVDAANSSMLRRILKAIERYVVGKPGTIVSALEVKEAEDVLANAATIDLCNCVDSVSIRISDFQLSEIRRANLDVFVNLSSSAHDDATISAARFGVWSCVSGLGDIDPNLPFGYLEVMESSLETWSEIHIRRSAQEPVHVAYRSSSSTVKTSLHDNASNVLWKALYFIPQLLEELQRKGEYHFFSARESHDECRKREFCNSSKELTNQRLALLLSKKIGQKIKIKWRELFYVRQWFLMYEFGQFQTESFSQFRRLMPPIDLSWADPFVVYRDQKHYIFFEECSVTQKRGHISVMVLSQDGTHTEPVKVLQSPYHLSYPFIFEYGRELYMIPESIENGTVDLYKCTQFPFEWSFQKHLMENCSMVDTTLIEVDGIWWMFANAARNANSSTCEELVAFYSDSPISDSWTPHPNNPIVSSVRSSRPAGKIFRHKGQIFRPSQNCSRHYGHSFNICQISKLTVFDYEEHIESVVWPSWDKKIHSIHTINSDSGLTVIDGQRWVTKIKLI